MEARFSGLTITSLLTNLKISIPFTLGKLKDLTCLILWHITVGCHFLLTMLTMIVQVVTVLLYGAEVDGGTIAVTTVI